MFIVYSVVCPLEYIEGRPEDSAEQQESRGRS